MRQIQWTGGHVTRWGGDDRLPAGTLNHRSLEPSPPRPEIGLGRGRASWGRQWSSGSRTPSIKAAAWLSRADTGLRQGLADLVPTSGRRPGPRCLTGPTAVRALRRTEADGGAIAPKRRWSPGWQGGLAGIGTAAALHGARSPKRAAKRADGDRTPRVRGASRRWEPRRTSGRGSPVTTRGDIAVRHRRCVLNRTPTTHRGSPSGPGRPGFTDRIGHGCRRAQIAGQRRALRVDPSPGRCAGSRGAAAPPARAERAGGGLPPASGPPPRPVRRGAAPRSAASESQPLRANSSESLPGIQGLDVPARGTFPPALSLRSRRSRFGPV